MSRSKQHYPLVYIEWEDSHSLSGSTWRDWGAVQKSGPCVMCRSVGWLVVNHRRYKTIVGSLSHGRHDRSVNQVSGDMTIPASAIRRLVRLPPRYACDKQQDD